MMRRWRQQGIRTAVTVGLSVSVPPACTGDGAARAGSRTTDGGGGAASGDGDAGRAPGAPAPTAQDDGGRGTDGAEGPASDSGLTGNTPDASSSTASCVASACPPLDGVSWLPCCTLAGECGLRVEFDQPVLGRSDFGCLERGLFVTDAGAGEDGSILEEGVIPVPDGDPILLDPSCEGSHMGASSLQFRLPGCCTVDGVCGSSTHAVQDDLPLLFLECASQADLEEYLDVTGFGDHLTLTGPSDPGQTCTYALPSDGGGLVDWGRPLDGAVEGGE